MGMSAGGDEGLFKLAEAAAPEEGRIMPAERTYVKSSKTVTLEDAVALMKRRKKDPSARIKGGLDDNSEFVRKGSNQNIQNDDKKADASQQLGPDGFDSKLANDEESRAKLLSALQNTKNGRVSTADLMKTILQVNSSVEALAKSVASIGSPVTTIQKEAEQVQEDKLKSFKSSSHRVSFVLNGMEFSVKCLNMVKDETAHTVVFVFQDDGDSFFTPPMQSELEVKYDGLQEPGKLYYFGMCFSLKDLGLKFLGFLYDDSTASSDK